jgi:ribose 5-phosphate isomerase A
MRYVRPGQTVGLGTGRAASAFIRAIGASGIVVRGIPTSKQSEDLARSLGIEIAALGATHVIDVTFDGADEVDSRLNLIKGKGGALVREKVVAAASRRCVILVGKEKLVRHLGAHGLLPVEVVPFAAPFCLRRIEGLGLRAEIRRNRDTRRDFISDNGNIVIDCHVRAIRNPRLLEYKLLSIPGVVGTGLFLSMADVVLVAQNNSAIRVMKRKR